MRVYGLDIKWLDGVADKGAFQMTVEEWDALFKNPTGWATFSVIKMAATILNCRIVPNTPVKPVSRKEVVAPDATWVWKDIDPNPNYTTCPPCPGAIYL